MKHTHILHTRGGYNNTGGRGTRFGRSAHEDGVQKQKYKNSNGNHHFQNKFKYVKADSAGKKPIANSVLLNK